MDSPHVDESKCFNICEEEFVPKKLQKIVPLSIGPTRLRAESDKSNWTCMFYPLDQWFPNGRCTPGVQNGLSRGYAKGSEFLLP